MTLPTADKLEAAYQAHGDYVLGVLARRSPFIRPPDRRAVYHDAFALVLEKARDGRLDVDAMSGRQLRAYLAKTAVLMALDQVRWGERAHTRPLSDADLERASGDEPAEERIADDAELAVLREIVAELPERRAAIIKLRYFFDRDPGEVQGLLGISARTYRLEIERGLRHIATRYEVARDGRWCDDRRSLILAYLAGIAGPRKAAEARMHLHACPGCTHMAAALRQAAEKVAAVVPMPDLALQDGVLHRAADGLAAARDQLMDLSGQAKQQAIGVVTRADPASGGNYLASARPGAMAAAVASCVAIGGGAATYCAVEGVPESLRAPLGLERAASADTDLKKPKPRPAKQSRTAQEQPASLVTDHPPAESEGSEPPPKPEQTPTDEVAQPPSTPAGRASREFGFEGANGEGGGASAQASSNQRPELSAPAGQPLGGGGPGGFER